MMEETPRFPSLFFRQRLNATVLPMLGGIALFLLLKTSLALTVSALFAVGITVLLFFRKGEGRKILLCVLLGLFASALLMGLHALEKPRLQALCDVPHQAEGCVVASQDGGYELELSRLDGEAFQKRVRIETEHQWSVGEKRAFTLVLLEHDPKSFRSDGIDFLADCREDRGVIGKSYLFTFIGEVRQSVKEDFASRKNGGFLTAILLGDREGLTDEQVSAFKQTASSHLLAISGLHISQAISFLVCFLNLMPISRKTVRVLLYPFVLILFLLAGAGVSVFRAGVMTLFSMTGLLLRYRSDSATSLTFSAALLVMANPYALESPSFLFSYASTFGLVTCGVPLSEFLREYFNKKKLNPFVKIWRPIALSFALAAVSFIFTVPVQLFLYQSASPFAPLYSVLLIPIFQLCLILTLISALALPFLPASVAGLPAELAAYFPDFVEFLSTGAPAPVYTGSFSPFLALFFITALTVMFVKKLPLTGIFLLHGVSFLFWAWFSLV